MIDITSVAISTAVNVGEFVAAPATVIGCPPDTPNEVYRKRNRYYPKTGHPPKLGRHEVEPSLDRELPKPAESFSRSWKAKKKKKRSSDVTAIK